VAAEAGEAREPGRARDRAEAREPVETEEEGGEKMKVCIPTMGNSCMEEAVCQHFGRAPTFTVLDLDAGTIRVLTNVSEHMGGSGLPTEAIFAEGVQVMIVGGLGPKAVQFFAEQCVEVFVGATGTVKDAIEDWREGLLTKASSDNACKEHRH
jgi:predicted Fe-Mo cluster-binding NifX family protein